MADATFTVKQANATADGFLKGTVDVGAQTLTLEVLDANGDPIANASVTLDPAGFKSFRDKMGAYQGVEGV